MQITKQDLLADIMNRPGIHVSDDPGLKDAAARFAKYSYRVYRVDVSDVNSKALLLRAIADALSFPEYFGNNWDALEECLRDLPINEKRGCLLIFVGADRLLTLPRQNLTTLTSILSNTAKFWKLENVRFTVLLAGGTELSIAVSEPGGLS